jgi:glucosyl-3-phosphoglycerate phosphatase
VSRLLLVRHGQSIWNAEARIPGQACRGLSTVGHTQAKALGEAVAEELALIEGPVALVTSDLQRCQETIRPLCERLAAEPDVDQRLRERSFGEWEGRLREEVARDDAERWGRFCSGQDVVAEVGGESAEELGDRVEPVLRELLTATPHDGVTVVVTHGGPVWQGLHRLLGLPLATLGGVANAGISEVVSWRAGSLALGRWNDVGHLEPGLRTTFAPPTARAEAPPVGR